MRISKAIEHKVRSLLRVSIFSLWVGAGVFHGSGLLGSTAARVRPINCIGTTDKLQIFV